MLKNLYNLLIFSLTHKTSIFNYLSIAQKYDKIHKNPDDVIEVINGEGVLNESEIQSNGEPIFLAVEGEGETYVAFHDNLFFIFSVDSELNDKIVKIYMKRPNDEWRIPFKPNSDELDLLNPSNVKVEVYVTYDVSVNKLNSFLNRCSGEEYTSGSWNKAFYRSFKDFIKKVEGFMEINQIKEAYEK